MKPRNSTVQGKGQKLVKKYVPTPEQAEIIKAYFLHNNFQDFNTWQQISKCKSEYQYTENNEGSYECKIIVKWQDSKMPIIAQVGEGKNKRRAKKKVLFKLIENLIFQGLIGYGFKDVDFIKKLPKRRKEDTSSESQELIEEEADSQVLSLLQKQQLSEAIEKLDYENFEQIWFYLLHKRDIKKCIEILRHLQRKPMEVEEKDWEFEQFEQQQWQDYCEKQFKNPEEEDLTDILQYYQLQWMQEEYEKVQVPKTNKRLLPCESLYLQPKPGKNLYKQFYPIDKTLSYQQQIQKQTAKEQILTTTNPFFELHAITPIPKFNEDSLFQLLPYRIVEQIYDSILYFSYDINFSLQLLSILEREITECQIPTSSEDRKESQKFYLERKAALVSQFSFLLNKKTFLPALSIQGMVTRFNNKYIAFHSKEPEEIFSQKIAKRNNISEFEEMPVFAKGEYVLLVSKLNDKDMHVGYIVELSPTIRIKVPTLINCSLKEKYPFTMYKLANSKVYEKISKSIVHISKRSLQIFKQNTQIIVQTPVSPIISIICELITEWSFSNQIILIVSEQAEELHKKLYEKGFKIGKMQAKFDEKSITKYQILSCTPSAVCCDILKNYQFTKVIIEGAQRISQVMSLLAIDKGCQRLYLIGDPSLPPPIVYSPFTKARKNMQKSLLQRLLPYHELTTFESKVEVLPYDASIFDQLNDYFYEGSLNERNKISTPIIKGFPWPCQTNRFAFIHHKLSETRTYLNKQAQLCQCILGSVLRSGFTDQQQIRFSTVSLNAHTILTQAINNFFRNNTQFQNSKQAGREGEKMVDLLSGLRFKQSDLSIFMGGYEALQKTDLNAILQESIRGVIIIGDLKLMSQESSEWRRLISWGKKKKLIMKFME